MFSSKLCYCNSIPIRAIHKDAATSVVRLLSVCCPSAIRRLVVAIVVNSLNCMLLGRRSSHVVHKCLHAIQPSVAYLYSSASIQRISRVFLVVASRFHLIPSRFLFAIWPSIESFPASTDKASAASGVPSLKCGGVDNRLYAAIALAVPSAKPTAFAFCGLRFDNETTESHSCKILLSHKDYYT